jgi:putative heme-binding domain-containing protein
VMNPPYLLFYPDNDRNDVPDGDPVVHLSGFGLEDTHAVASSLMWGPDGWLYGCQGSTCTAKVKAELSADKDAKTTDFLGQAVWRYHPDRHVFEIFAEGGGNTFGLEFDDEGRAFSGTNWGKFRGLHYVQGGYYVKGWGKHGPLTNPYAFGFFEHMPHEGNADRLSHTFVVYGGGLMHGLTGKIVSPNSLQSRVQVTRLEQHGSTFRTVEEPFLMTTDDGWFRPVDLKTGPDGAIYVADFYEKRISHVDPRDTWDRGTGRIWRIRPADWRPAGEPADVGKVASDDLLGRGVLVNTDRWIRATSRRLLAERKDAGRFLKGMTREEGSVAREALWALHAAGQLDEETTLAAMGHAEPSVRMWAARLAADERGKVLPPALVGKLIEMARGEDDPEIRSQLASTAKRLAGEQALPVILAMLAHEADASDPHVPLLLWWAVEDKAVSHREQVLSAFTAPEVWRRRLAREVVLPRLARRYAADATAENQAALVRLLDAAPGDAERKVLLSGVKEAFAGGPVKNLEPSLRQALANSGDAELALRLGDTRSVESALKLVADDSDAAKAERLRTIELLGQVGRSDTANALLDAAGSSRWHSVRKAALAALARLDDPALGERVVRMYPKLPKDQGVRPAAVAMLVSRPIWAAALLKAVEAGAIPKDDVPAAQVDRLRETEDRNVAAMAERIFGKAARATSAELAAETGRVKLVVTSGKGDPAAGKATFTARCAACHVLFGEGGKTAPDLTGYERRNVDFLVFNVVDPSAAVREEFTSFRVKTTDGQVFEGLISESDANQIALVDAAGQRSVIPKARVADERALSTSIMPEGLLAGLSDQQLRDFFAYLAAPAK